MIATSRPRRFRRHLGFAIAGVALVVAGCGSGDAAESAGSSLTGSGPATSGPASTGSAGSGSAGSGPAGSGPAGTDSAGSDPAPDTIAVVPAVLQFASPLVGGGNFEGASVAGKPSAFWFWAPT